jgi:hypothetical protein
MKVISDVASGQRTYYGGPFGTHRLFDSNSIVKGNNMKRTAIFLGVLATALLCQGAAFAATTKTAVLFSGAVTTDVPLNVSGCSQIRVTASLPKSGTAFVFLWDDSAPTTDLLAAPVVMALNDTTPYASVLLETPGLTLTISGSGGASAIVYCR